jgi:hypothetical protein
MSRNKIQPALVLLAAAALTSPLTAQAEKTRETPSEVAQPTPGTRDAARQAAHFESVHRTQAARIDRLIAIYTAKGDRAKVTELQALREREGQRHRNAMGGFRRQMGPEAWGRLEKEMQGPSARERRSQNANQSERERAAREAANERQRSQQRERSKENARPPERPPERPPARPPERPPAPPPQERPPHRPDGRN